MLVRLLPHNYVKVANVFTSDRKVDIYPQVMLTPVLYVAPM